MPKFEFRTVSEFLPASNVQASPGKLIYSTQLCVYGRQIKKNEHQLCFKLQKKDGVSYYGAKFCSKRMEKYVPRNISHAACVESQRLALCFIYKTGGFGRIGESDISGEFSEVDKEQ